MSTATEAPAPDPGAENAPTTTAPRRLAALLQAEEPRARGWGLAARVFLGAAALLALALGAATLLASRRARQVAEEEIHRDLAAVPKIYEGWRSALSLAREGQLASLAAEPGTKALVAELEANPETFADTGRDFAKGLGARTVFFFDGRGHLISRSDREPGEESGRDFSPVAWVQRPLTQLEKASAYILEVRARTLSLVASAPVVQGEGAERRLTGVIAAAFPIDRARAGELAQVTSGEAAFLANLAERGAAPALAVVASTPRLDQPAVASRFAAAAGALPAVFGEGRPFGPLEFTLGGELFVATALPIKTGGGETVAALLVARSKDAEMAAFRRVRDSLLLTGGALLLLSLPLSFLLAQRVARPLRQLAQGAAAIGRGQLDVPLPRSGAGEVGALARAFAGMVEELKGKAELEALVAELQRRPGDVTFRGALPGGAAAAGTAPLEPGRVFAGRYEILSRLGEGGMGAVFRTRDRELDDEVALKVLKLRGDQGGAAERLRHEIRLARQITHPNVVRVHDFGEAEGTYFFTMEYVPGTTLRELLDQRGAFELVPGLQLAKQLCRGLDAVHRARIIHGDIKPQNLMVMGNGVAKLMDFGVARARTQEGGVMAGTPLYMSPEQTRGAELDERSDLYSAGVLMFEVFTGRCPFAATDMYEIMRLHSSEPPPNPRSLRPQLPEALAQIVLSCLAKARLHRPGSAAELDRLLTRVRM
ncbi:MAG TPA: protein kinase [Vicinamibacteria bacterium]